MPWVEPPWCARCFTAASRAELCVSSRIRIGLFSFIPYVGIIVGILFSLIAAIIQMADPSIYLGIVSIFLIGQLLESVFLSPLLVGDRVGLHPVLIIFAVMAGGELFGFFGVLAAIPFAAIGLVLIRHLIENLKSENEI